MCFSYDGSLVSQEKHDVFYFLIHFFLTRCWVTGVSQEKRLRPEVCYSEGKRNVQADHVKRGQHPSTLTRTLSFLRFCIGRLFVTLTQRIDV